MLVLDTTKNSLSDRQGYHGDRGWQSRKQTANNDHHHNLMSRWYVNSKLVRG